jgi:signal peptidase I
MYVAQPFVVSGESMDSTFADGQYLYVDELSYRFEKPIRGEVIIFKFPSNTSRDLIKRVVGLPGETVELKKDSVTIYNKEYPQGLVLDEPYVTHKSESYEAKKTVLADDEYYVLGDNRPVSYDSRGWGPLKAQFIIGRPFVRLLPVSSISLFPGEYTDY